MRRSLLACTLVLAVYSAGCGSDPPHQQEPPPPDEYAVGGTVSGLAGQGLILQVALEAGSLLEPGHRGRRAIHLRAAAPRRSDV